MLIFVRENLKKDILWRWRFNRGRLLSRWWNSLSVTFSILVTTWVILAVELTLFWNAVEGVYNLSTVGQLIPFIIGMLGLVRSLHLVIMEYLEMVCFSPNLLIILCLHHWHEPCASECLQEHVRSPHTRVMKLRIDHMV